MPTLRVREALAGQHCRGVSFRVVVGAAAEDGLDYHGRKSLTQEQSGAHDLGMDDLVIYKLIKPDDQDYLESKHLGMISQTVGEGAPEGRLTGAGFWENEWRIQGSKRHKSLDQSLRDIFENLLIPKSRVLSPDLLFLGHRVR